jgi:hypothetical protein
MEYPKGFADIPLKMHICYLYRENNMKETVNKNITSKAEKALRQFKKILSKLDVSEKETLELMLDGEAQKNIERSREEFKRGEFMTLEEFKKA